MHYHRYIGHGLWASVYNFHLDYAFITDLYHEECCAETSTYYFVQKINRQLLMGDSGSEKEERGWDVYAFVQYTL